MIGEAVFPYIPLWHKSMMGPIHISIQSFEYVPLFVLVLTEESFIFSFIGVVKDSPWSQNPAIRSHLWQHASKVGISCMWESSVSWERADFPRSKLLSKLPCAHSSSEYQCSSGRVHWLDSVKKHLRVFSLFCFLSRNNYLMRLSDKYPCIPTYLQRTVSLISWQK